MPNYQGDPVLLTFPLRDDAGTLVDPSVDQPVVTVTLPDGTTATPPVTHVSTGIFTARYVTTQVGHHQADWVCVDPVNPGALADSFDVWSPAETTILSFAGALTTLGLPANLDTTNAAMADLVREFNGGISSWLEWYCGVVVQRTVVEELPAGGSLVQLSNYPVLDLVAWTQVPAQLSGYPGFSLALANGGPMFPTHVFGVTYPLNQLYVSQDKGIVTHTSGLQFYNGPFLWQYLPGYSVIPHEITYANRVLLKHLWGMERGGAGGVGLGAADEEMTAGPLGFMVPNRLLEALVPDGQPAAIA